MRSDRGSRGNLPARTSRSSAVALVAAAGAVSAFVFTSAAPGAAGSTTPLCFGEQATIVLEQGQTDGLLEGTTGADVIVARDFTQAITINGLGGDDLICVFDGIDLPGQHVYTVKGGPGHDKIGGSARADKILGGSDADEIRGGGGNDVLHGDPGNDRIFGDAGDDDLNGSVGDDNLFSGTGDDNNNGGLGRDFADGGAGTDFCRLNVEKMVSCGHKFNER